MPLKKLAFIGICVMSASALLKLYDLNKFFPANIIGNIKTALLYDTKFNDNRLSFSTNVQKAIIDNNAALIFFTKCDNKGNSKSSVKAAIPPESLNPSSLSIFNDFIDGTKSYEYNELWWSSSNSGSISIDAFLGLHSRFKTSSSTSGPLSIPDLVDSAFVPNIISEKSKFEINECFRNQDSASSVSISDSLKYFENNFKVEDKIVKTANGASLKLDAASGEDAKSKVAELTHYFKKEGQLAQYLYAQRPYLYDDKKGYLTEAIVSLKDGYVTVKSATNLQEETAKSTVTVEWASKK